MTPTFHNEALVDWTAYQPGRFFDELLAGPGQARAITAGLVGYLASLSLEEVRRRLHAAEHAIRAMGITFTVYSEGSNIDRIWPYDIIPRVIAGAEWAHTRVGLTQRLRALNCFIDDVYHDQRIVKEGIIPGELLARSRNFRPQCVGATPAFGVWAHICGTDLVRDHDGTLYVLEDNLRVPSGVSYMLENRKITRRVFPELLEQLRVEPIHDYPNQLAAALRSLSPRGRDWAEVVVLTPGIYNSAYFEHSFLAQQMGAELVEGGDLYVAEDDCVYMRTINGPARVDVIYRRVDDLFLDPQVFLADSMLGVPGLMRAWRAGNVALANAPGAGVADDKVVYAYVPDMIRYYLGEQPLLPNVPTYICERRDDRQYVLEHLDELVVKPANESGGYGMLMGPQSTRAQQSEFAARIKDDPRNYVAQPLVAISTCPTLCGDRIEPRHIDLRPFVLQAERSYVTAGGLTRVAMLKGSYVVNSSQGGGSKDTWVVG